MAIPKKFRFSSSVKINSLFTTAKVKKYPLFSLLADPNQEKQPRLTIIVSKKIDQKATVRNSLKRKFSLPLSIFLKKYQFKPFDIVLLPKKQALVKTQKEIASEIKKVLKKERIIN